MTTPPPPESGAGASPRRPRGRPAVPLDRILAAALQLVDDEGADALSMRTLAQRLQSGTATLYRHFENRGQLITHVVDRLFGEVPLDRQALESVSWHEACQAVAQAMFDTLSKHRNAAPLLIEQTPTGPNAMRLREHCLALLLDGGLPPHRAARAYATLSRFVLGFAIQLTGVQDEAEERRAAARFHEVAATEYPATLAVADSLPVSLEDEFAFGLELLITSLRQMREE